MNLYQKFVQTVTKSPNKTMISHNDTALTFKKSFDLAAGVSKILGDKSGKTVGILSHNNVQYPAGVMGAYRSGAVVCPLNAMLSPQELIPQIIHSEICVLIISQMFAGYIDIFKENGIDIPIYILEDIEEDAEFTKEYADFPETQLAVLMYTSGTTAEPKGVMLTHKSFIENCASFSSVLSFTENDTFLTAIPFFHTFSFTTNLVSTIINGMSIRLILPFNPKIALRELLQGESMIMTAVAPMFALIAGRAAHEGGVDLSKSLRVAVSGGGPLPRSMYEAFKEHTGVEILEGYGLTEAPVTNCNPAPGEKNHLGTIGPAIPDIKIEIRDEEGNELPTGKEGEICIKGSNVMQGYFKNEEATASAFFPGGWLRTGDLGYVQDDGYFKISGRAKELIISSGENIHPLEIEEEILKHPTVARAAVVAHPDKLKQEVPKAFLEPHEGEEVDSIIHEEVKEFLKGKLAPHKIPVYWETMPELPRLFAAKIDKKVLANLCQ